MDLVPARWGTHDRARGLELLVSTLMVLSLHRFQGTCLFAHLTDCINFTEAYVLA